MKFYVEQVLRDILKDVQTSLVPRTIVREWAASTFQSATDYWTFRKVMLSPQYNISIALSTGRGGLLRVIFIQLSSNPLVQNLSLLSASLLVFYDNPVR